MRKCSACGETYRVGRTALVVSNVGGSERARVCRECARGGLLVVAKRVETPVAVTLKRNDDATEALRVLRTLREVCDDDRRAEGLDQAIGVLSKR